MNVLGCLRSGSKDWRKSPVSLYLYPKGRTRGLELRSLVFVMVSRGCSLCEFVSSFSDGWSFSKEVICLTTLDTPFNSFSGRAVVLKDPLKGWVARFCAGGTCVLMIDLRLVGEDTATYLRCAAPNAEANAADYGKSQRSV